MHLFAIRDAEANSLSKNFVGIHFYGVYKARNDIMENNWTEKSQASIFLHAKKIQSTIWVERERVCGGVSLCVCVQQGPFHWKAAELFLCMSLWVPYSNPFSEINSSNWFFHVDFNLFFIYVLRQQVMLVQIEKAKSKPREKEKQ